MSFDIKSFVLAKLGEKQVNQLSNEEFAQLISDIFAQCNTSQSVQNNIRRQLS